METEKSVIDILKDYALSNNKEIKHYRDEYRVSSIKPRFFYRSYSVINNVPNNSVLFVSYADSKAFGESSFFSGLFFPISVSSSAKINIRRKDILDRLNVFLKPNIYRSRFSNFNSNVLIDGNDNYFASKLLDNNKVQDLILELLKVDARINIGVNNIKFAEVAELKNEFSKDSNEIYFEVYIKGEWFLETSVINNLFVIVQKLQNLLN